MHYIFITPGVAGAVFKSPLSFIKSLTELVILLFRIFKTRARGLDAPDSVSESVEHEVESVTGAVETELEKITGSVAATTTIEGMSAGAAVLARHQCSS